MENNPELFDSGYWANAVPDHIEDGTFYVKKLEAGVDNVISVRQHAGKDLHISKAGWLTSKVKKFGLQIVNVLVESLRVKDNIIDENLREVRWYRGDQYIADRMRAPLEKALRKAWDEKKKVLIISHSMGTFVSYDVLNFFLLHEQSFNKEDLFKNLKYSDIFLVFNFKETM